MSENPELLPCPFCGNELIHRHKEHLIVVCAFCNAAAPNFAWNRRARWVNFSPEELESLRPYWPKSRSGVDEVLQNEIDAELARRKKEAKPPSV
jgi:hypothetical protein